MPPGGDSAWQHPAVGSMVRAEPDDEYPLDGAGRLVDPAGIRMMGQPGESSGR